MDLVFGGEEGLLVESKVKLSIDFKCHNQFLFSGVLLGGWLLHVLEEGKAFASGIFLPWYPCQT